MRGNQQTSRTWVYHSATKDGTTGDHRICDFLPGFAHQNFKPLNVLGCVGPCSFWSFFVAARKIKFDDGGELKGIGSFYHWGLHLSV